MLEIFSQFCHACSALSLRFIQTSSDSQITQKIQALSSIYPPQDPRHRYFQKPHFLSPHKEKEWSQSRLSIFQVFQCLQSQGVQPLDILLSLSHNQEQTIAIAAQQSPRLVGIGVDLERSDRKISSKAARSFLSLQEREKTPPLSPLHYWIIKEACYKANPDSQGTFMSHYCIHHIDLSSLEGKAYLIQNPKMIFRFKIAQIDKTLFAFAMLEKNL